jgi:hypothetical protein
VGISLAYLEPSISPEQQSNLGADSPQCWMGLFLHPMKDGVLLDFGATKTVGLDMYMEYGWQSNNRIRRALGGTCIFYSFLIKGNILIS